MTMNTTNTTRTPKPKKKPNRPPRHVQMQRQAERELQMQQEQQKQQQMQRRQRNRKRSKVALAGGSMLAAGLLLTDLQGVVQPPAPTNVCQEVVQSQAVLSRDQLSRLLNVPERSDRTAVRSIVNEPYCKLAPIEVRAGVTAEREAYPLAFDPKTWLVVLYEGEEYAGYDFVFQR